MSKLTRRGLIWGLVGAGMSLYSLVGVFNAVYRQFPSEPTILSLGVLGCVISLIGIVYAARRQTGWVTAWLVLTFWLALAGAVVDGLLLWFGQTVTGFY